MTLQNMLAVSGGKLSKDMLAGTITFSTVPDRPVSATKLLRLAQSEGLDTTRIPREQGARHAFQRAVRSVETRRRNGSNIDAEIKVDEVAENPTECVYQVTRLLRDREDRVIDFPPGMRVVFHKDTESITFDPFKPEHYDAVKHLTNDIERAYDNGANKVTGYKVRELLRAYMADFHATPLRRTGSIYFVPIEAADTMEALARVLDKLYGGDAELVMIPVADSKGTRELVEKHHVFHVNALADEMLAEVTNYIKKGRIRPDKMANIVSQRKQMGAYRASYEDIIGNQQAEVNSKLTTLDDGLEKLMEVAYA